jgi:mono/diheme cytochrome c family protein
VAASAVSAAPEEQMTLGKTAYMTCAACHGMDGKGMQVGPQKMAPSFEGSELLLGQAEAPIVAVLKGIHKAPDSPYLGQMMALGAGMDDKSIAAVLTYARNSFGNSASAITPEQVAAARTDYAGVDAPMGLQRADLEKVAKGE